MLELIKRFIALPSNVKWGTLWILISIIGFVLVYTGHGIQIASCKNSNIISVNGTLTYPTALVNPSDNIDLWGFKNESQDN